MKIAIFHDWIGPIGGGEKLILTLAREIHADVITTDLNVDSIKKMGFEDVNIISLGRTIKLPVLKLLSLTFLFALCDFTEEYDFFIFSNNFSYFAARKHKPNLWYCSSPPRIFYDLYNVFEQKQPYIRRQFFKVWIAIHKSLSRKFVDHVEFIVANSINVQKRIEKFYSLDSTVVYPGIDISKYGCEKYGDFWLSVNRLSPEKRIELQINSFRQIPGEKLIIVGDFPKGDRYEKYASTILKDLPDNIKVFGSISETELVHLYATCKGHITTALDEDFGMTPVEAMASGKPVMAVREGGYLETVVDGVTGMLVGANEEAIINAVKLISKHPERYNNQCMDRAKDFDVTVFIKNMVDIIISIKSNSTVNYPRLKTGGISRKGCEQLVDKVA